MGSQELSQHPVLGLGGALVGSQERPDLPGGVSPGQECHGPQ
jgi:hypothetical protein